MEIKVGYKISEVGLIPKNWNVKNIVQTSSLKARIGWQGLTTNEYLEDGNYYLITGTDFENGKIRWKTCHFVSKNRYDQDRNIQLKVNDILVTKDGTIGKIAYIDQLPMKATLNSGVFVIRPVKDEYIQHYIYFVFSSKYFDNFLKKLVAGSTINHLYQKDFVSFQFPLPPYEEQQAIATTLSETNSLINSLEKLIDKKKAIKQGAMQELLTPKEGWKVKKLGDVAIIMRGASPRPIDSPIWFDENSSVGWVRITDVTKSNKYLTETEQCLSPDGIKSSRFIPKGNLIMSICATVGRPILTSIDVCIHDGFVVFSSTKINIVFLYYFLTCIEKSWTIHGQTGSQMNLNTGIINSTLISFPYNPNEQSKIAEVLSEMDEDINVSQRKLEKYRLLKQSIMEQLLTGKIRIL